MEVLPGEIWGLQDEVVTDKGLLDEQVVPLEKDRSGMVPPIITPSEEVVQVVEHERELGAVLSKAHGILNLCPATKETVQCYCKLQYMDSRGI